MFRFLLRLLLIVGLPVLASPGAAQAVDPDVRCLVLSNWFARSDKDPGRKQLAAASATYFLGRIDARLSDAQLRTQVVALGKSLNKDNAGPLMNACVRRFADKQKAMLAMGQSITAGQKK